MESLSRFLFIRIFISIFVFLWLFSGWPQIFDFPPTIQEAHASHTLTVEATGTPSATVSPGGTGVAIATFGFGQIRNELVIRVLRFHEYGTVDSSLITNIKLYRDDGDGVWEPAQDTTQVGATVSGFTADYATVTGVGMPAECAADPSPFSDGSTV